MMATIFNSAILDSAILHKTLTQTSSIWLKLIYSQSTWWYQISWILPSWIWPSWIQPSLFFLSNSLTLAKISYQHFNKKTSLIHSDSYLMIAVILKSAILNSAILHKKTSLIHSDSTWWWQPSWILPSWIQTLPSWIDIPYYLLSDSLTNTLPPLWLWLTLIPSD